MEWQEQETKLSLTEFNCLSKYIREECGIDLSVEKQYLIIARLSGMLRTEKCRTYMDLYWRARNDSSKRLRDEIIDAITTKETFWFRDDKIWGALEDVIIPGFIKEIKQGNMTKVSIWSAGCSTGQEPYSLVMLINAMLHNMHLNLMNCFSITATDISLTALSLAKQGRYNRILMSRGLTSEYREKYFEKKGNIWQLRREICDAVTFKKVNILNIPPELGTFDLILCRNVAIYFSEQFKKKLFKNITDSLTLGGYLVLGASETLSPYLPGYEVCQNGKGTYFRLKNKDG